MTAAQRRASRELDQLLAALCPRRQPALREPARPAVPCTSACWSLGVAQLALTRPGSCCDTPVVTA